MKNEFIFTKELAKKLNDSDKMAYAIKYGLGLATKSEDAEYAEKLLSEQEEEKDLD